jgi:lipoprotein-anchoring transpeptidase ErfK/SrfK
VRHGAWSAAAAVLTLASACEVTVNQNDAQEQQQGNQPAAAPQPPPTPAQTQLREQGRQELRDLRFVVDKSERELRVFLGDRPLSTHDVTIGTTEYPTRTGSWAIHRVDLNPEWIPPKNEAWARKEERQPPGDPENPMGRARLVYDEPRTVHGTDETDTLGMRASHGSIRVANPVALQLAEMALKAGGAWQGPEWFAGMTSNRTREFQIKLEQPIPIVVQE